MCSSSLLSSLILFTSGFFDHGSQASVLLILLTSSYDVLQAPPMVSRTDSPKHAFLGDYWSANYIITRRLIPRLFQVGVSNPFFPWSRRTIFRYQGFSSVSFVVCLPLA